MSFMLQIWMKLMVLMLLMMSNLTIMTMMMILMMIRPGEGGTFCWSASQLALQPINIMIYDLTIKDYIIFRETIKKIVVPLWIFLIVSTIVLAREPSIFLIAFKH